MFDKVDINKKYDLVIVSNMLEYLEGNVESLVRVRNNLEKLLKDDGQVICSFIVNDHLCDRFLVEKEVFTDGNLEFENYYKYYEPLIGKNNEAGYSYKLKRTKK